jgi:hypothetical protein
MITAEQNFNDLYAYLSDNGKSTLDRYDVGKLMNCINWELVHDEPGVYDPSIDGYLIYKNPKDDTLWRIDFYEDSYSSGTLSGVREVSKSTKTVTVYE